MASLILQERERGAIFEKDEPRAPEVCPGPGEAPTFQSYYDRDNGGVGVWPRQR